eukprot:261929-Pyramimonas_sp.AAC.1
MMPNADPEIALVVQGADLWLKTRRDHPHIRDGVGKVWPRIVQQLQAAKHSDQVRLVRGPVSAMVLNLLRIGWQPVSPSQWSYSTGEDTYE